MSTSVPPPGFQSPTTYAPEPAQDPAPALRMQAPSSGRARLRPARSRLLGGGLVLVAAVVAAFVALGSTSTPGSDPIAQAATLSSTTPGYRMNLAMSISGSNLTQPISAYGSAIVDLRDQAESMSLTMDLSGEPQAAQMLGSTTMTIGLIQDHGDVYMKLPEAVMQAIPGLGGKRWLRMDVSKLSGVPGISSLTGNSTMSDPSRMLDYLRAASSSITNDGFQRVHGVQTTHYHAILDLSTLAANLPASERPQVQQALSALEQEAGAQGVPFDVWVDAQHLVRRIGMSISLNATNGATGQVAMTADLSDYGPQRRPTPPPAGQVQDLTNLIHVAS